MKKFTAALLMILILMNAAAIFCNAVVVNVCVTWIIKPERIGQFKSYVAYYYKTGDVIKAPDIETPTYETADNHYVFLGWKHMTTAKEINDYYDNKRGIGFHEEFVQEPFPEVKDKDLCFAAVFRLVPKIYDIDNDRDITISDVTALLNFLSKESEYDISFDCDRDHEINIKDVTVLLNFLAE